VRAFILSSFHPLIIMKEKIINGFIEFIQKKKLIKKNDRILAGVSGGVDSVVMLSLLMEIRKRYSLNIAVAHVNYGLRGEDSDRDQKLVEDICRKNEIPIYIHIAKRKSVLQNRSVQIKAREVRYKFYGKICKDENYNKIAIAHNANDNAETVLFNLFRGTGIDGIKGIPVSRENIIRPILFLKREEILAYAKQNHVRFRHDKSNFSDKYSRNFIRLKILPQAVNRINPKALENINHFSEILSDFSDFTEKYVKSAVKSACIIKSTSEFSLDIKKLNNYISFIREKVIINCYRNFFNTSLSRDKVLKILDLIDSQTGRMISLSKDVTLWKERDSIVFRKKRRELSRKDIHEPGFDESVRIDDQIISVSCTDKFELNTNSLVEYIDKDQVFGKFLLRRWKPGDYFYPLGMKGKKKVSDFLTDLKFSSSLKSSVLVLENNGKIIWLAGLRLDDRFKCTKKTKNILKLEIKRNL